VDLHGGRQVFERTMRLFECPMRKFYFLIACCAVVLDHFAKWAIGRNVSLDDSVPVIPGFLSLTHVENRGAAFGLFGDAASEWNVAILILLSLVAVTVVAALLWKSGDLMTTTGVGLALILGGALGNLWDRLASGQVMDYMLLQVGEHQLLTFNLADGAVVIGAGLLAFQIIFAKFPVREQGGDSKGERPAKVHCIELCVPGANPAARRSDKSAAKGDHRPA
jgi:signal peptidase II